MDIEQGMSDEYILEQEAVQVEPAGGYGIFSAVAAMSHSFNFPMVEAAPD